MKKEEFLQLAEKISLGSATDPEIARYNSWFNSQENQANWDKSQMGDRDQKESSILQNIQAEIEQFKVSKVRSIWPRFAAAATVVLGLAISGYFLLSKKADRQTVKILTHDIAPGTEKATLTLADGKKIILAGAQNGKLAQQGNTAITKTHEGQIMYNAGAQSTTVEIVYNTLRTPNGGEYHIVLADGSNVWLNAASSITYPTTFTGDDRTVEITGEAYFEVAHNAAKPFRVKCQGQTVEVLGTHFNINAYDDENAIRTTLLQGSVKVITGGYTALLEPGQQSQVINSTGVFKGVENVDTDEAVAWKNGSFQFDQADIKDIMRQFARWYDVDVVYQGNIKERIFSGSIHRNLSVAEALELMSFTNVHFTIDDKKIIVSNN